MRGGVLFGAETEKEYVDLARFKLFQITNQLAFQVFGVSAHRGEAFDLAKKVRAQQSLEVAHEAEAIFHAHRRQCVLREDVKTTEQMIDFVCLRLLAD